MERLLCIVGSMNAGGAETFLMKIYRKIDKSKYQMDFAVSTDEEGFYDAEIISMGGRIFHIVPKSKGVIKNFITIQRLVSQEGYKAVFRTSHHSLAALDLLAAKLGGAQKCIFRSSNSKAESVIELMLHRLFFFMPRRFANVRFAPSTEAAEFVFGSNCVSKGNAILVHNGVDLSVYSYKQEDREAVRKELGLQNKTVIGHIGRYYPQKNHRKLIEVFSYILNDIPNAILLIIGEGELEGEIRAQIRKLGIEDKVIFTGIRKDVPRLLSGMDIFIFPSIYEGMPNTVIEAQATGLPCLVSNTVTKEVKVTDCVEFLELEASSSLWAKKALQMTMKKRDRREYAQLLIKSGYDIDSCAKQFIGLTFDENSW